MLIERTGSADPRALSTAARYGRPWAGLTGIYAFDANGNQFGKHYRFQVLQFGRWWPLPGVAAPSLLSGFSAYQGERAVAAPASLGATAAAAAPTPDGRDQTALSEPTVSPLQHHRTWLALAKDIRRFKRLGVVVPPSEPGRAAAGDAGAASPGAGSRARGERRRERDPR